MSVEALEPALERGRTWHETETVDGELFLAMAFYEGETLEARLARGALPALEALRIAREVADGLEFQLGPPRLIPGRCNGVSWCF